MLAKKFHLTFTQHNLTFARWANWHLHVYERYGPNQGS